MNGLFKLMNHSIGKKILVGVTGLLICFFLVGHIYINIHLLPIPGFSDDGGAKFIELCTFLDSNLIIKIFEFGLLICFLVHIFYALKVNIENKKAKPIKYSVNIGNQTSKWTSRNMVLFGITLFLFLCIHVYGIFIKNNFMDTGKSIFTLTVEVLSNKIYSSIYILGFAGNA